MYFEKGSRFLLCDDACFFDQLDVWLRAAVADRRLVRIHLDEHIVHLEAGERGKHVLDSVNLYVPLGDGRRALDRFHVLDLRVDGRFVRKIGALEFSPKTRGRGMQSQRDLFTGVKRGARERGAAGKCVLERRFGGHGVERIDSSESWRSEVFSARPTHLRGANRCISGCPGADGGQAHVRRRSAI